MHSLNIYFTGVNRVELRVEPVREVLPDHVLVRARASLISSGTEGICLSRAFEPDSHWDRWVQYPFAPGYSMIGIIEQVGSTVDNLRVGDCVAVRAPHQQYIHIPAHRRALLRVPEGIAADEATWFALAKIAQAGVRAAEHVLGDAVAIIGQGPVGQLVTQHVRLQGAREIIVIDPVSERLALAQKHGATTVLGTTVDAARNVVDQVTGGQGVDVVYDVTGAAPVMAQALPLLRRFGRLVLLGDTGTPTAQHLTSDVITRGLRIIGAHDGHSPSVSSDHARWDAYEMTELFFTYLKRGDMSVADLITHHFAPTDAPAAYQLLRETPRIAMGVVFDWTQL
jgi:2-desacetyl-2-hydroxyethyl bacteriochlorophyllide A dehydrogenase